jgi:NAD(P)-dependent dehydrogenase (short-subunit alcohol dehydrogenase family)
MTQSLRAFLAGEGVTVHTIFLGPIDNDMSRGLEISKASPQSAALGIFEGLEDGEEDIFPDPASRPLTEGWRAGVVKALASATHDDCACSSVDVRYPLASDDFVSRNDANDH